MNPTNVCRIALLFLSSLAPVVSGAEPSLQVIDAAPPQEVSAAIRASLAPQGFRVVSDDAALMELWVRAEVSVDEGASAPLGASFGKLPEGTLIAVVRLPATWSDYKKNPIPAGVYTLRYAIQPADGNHMGVSLYRDFLILIPAAEDTSVDTALDRDAWLVQSYAATGKPHPGVLGLFPVDKDLPRPEMMQNELDQWMLAVPIGWLKMGLVVEGHGELEGY
jgi:hypothetical protein